MPPRGPHLAIVSLLVACTKLTAAPAISGSPQTVLENIYFRSAEAMNQIADRSVQFVLMGPPYPGAGSEDLQKDRNLLAKTWVEVDRVLRDDGAVAVVQTDLASSAGKYWRHDVVRELGESQGFELFDHKFEIRGLRRDLYRRKVRNILLFRKQRKIKMHPIPEFYPDAWLLFVSQKMGKFKDAYSPDLVRILVETFTDPNDLVLAPFAGTGTTVAVSLGLGRRAKGYELNKKMRDLIRERAVNLSDYFQRPEQIFDYVLDTLLQKLPDDECVKTIGEMQRILSRQESKSRSPNRAQKAK